MAAANKCLARINKSRTWVPATNKRSAASGAANWRSPHCGVSAAGSFRPFSGASRSEAEYEAPSRPVFFPLSACRLCGLPGYRKHPEILQAETAGSRDETVGRTAIASEASTIARHLHGVLHLSELLPRTHARTPLRVEAAGCLLASVRD